MIWIVLILVALAWASWLFGGSFSGKHRKSVFIVMILVVCVSGLGLYYKLGGHSELNALYQQHEINQSLSISELADKVDDDSFTVKDLLSELRLRSELDSDNTDSWMQLGRLFLQLQELDQAQLAFDRAFSIDKNIDLKLEAVRNLMELPTQQSFSPSQRLLTEVLVIKPNHEGALLLQGVNYFKNKEYEKAIHYWQLLQRQKEPESASWALIQDQIDAATKEQEFLLNNRIVVEAVIDENTFSAVALQSFTKAFVIVRPQQGGIPIAVKTIELGTLPESIAITEEDVMLPDASLFQAVDIIVEVRLSQSGFAKAEVGDIFGRSSAFTALSKGQIVPIQVTETVK